MKCPRCFGKGTLSLDKPCFSCNSTGKVDHAQALAQVDFWNRKFEASSSIVDKANLDMWEEIASSLKENKTEFESFGEALEHFKKNHPEEFDYEIECALSDMANFCDTLNLSITFSKDGAVIING